MKSSNIIFFIELIISFLPFILFAFFNSKANVKKEVRNRQYLMPVFAVVYSVVLFIFLNWVSKLILKLFLNLAGLFDKIRLTMVGNFIRDIYNSWGVFLTLILFNTAALLLYIILKRIITLILGKIKVRQGTFVGNVVELFYSYDEQEERWYIKDHLGQARTFIKTAYYGSCFVSAVAMLISCSLCMKHLVSAPFYPVFAVIIIGEMAFFIDGIRPEEEKSEISMQADRSRHIAMYALLRKPLKALFGDKLAAEGTTVNNGSASGGAIEDILSDLEENGGHVGKNYAAFIRRKAECGLKPNVDYIRSGYDLAIGKSLLFNTPFYDKLNPYVFYAMNRELLKGGKVLIVLGRHGTEEDLLQWSQTGMKAVSNIPDLWKIAVLSGDKKDEDSLPDIGIVSRSGVHDLDIHKNNLPFLKKVSFVIVVEPSRLVTTAQIGLNLLIKCCGNDHAITYCSIDRNCDGLVDALSHILMTNITEVSATEYPHGMSSYMYWTADDDYLQHRILPGVSRCLGMGTELSMVALRNQVKEAVWYGGEAFPVKDARWIAKQYYHDLLEYAQLPTTQETFDKCFKTSINMCDQRSSDYSYITVEDDRNNLFETRRNFATVAEQQGFVNVISSEYMLREYMSSNTELFTADAKAIPYITADYARTKRNAILSLCLLLCVDSVKEDVLHRQLAMLNIDTKEPIAELWKEIYLIFSNGKSHESDSEKVLRVESRDGEQFNFERDATILYKRIYSIETGKFESVYTIENKNFSRIILDDLQNASYIAEQESQDVYIGTELKGHVYQKYMPGQFFTLNGKYYEMVSTATDNRILVRRASEHIGGRLSYRQVRNYTINHIEDSLSMGALKTVNNIDIHYKFADFSVETPGYWKLKAYNNFDDGALVHVNGVPTREYHHKQILKFDFSKLGDAFTDSVRMTLTNLLNEVFVTLFADNQPFISAITPGKFDAPITYSLELAEGIESSEKCIYIIEDSQLDIGLLVAVERNINRIFQIISDYLSWNEEQIAESLREPEQPEETKTEGEEGKEEQKPEKKKNVFVKVFDWFKGLFKKKDKNKTAEVPAQDYMMIYGKPHKLVKGKWVACSQEEFDKKMNARHKAQEEKARIEKENKEREKAQRESEENSEETGVMVEIESAEDVNSTDETTSEEDSTEALDDAADETPSETADENEEDTPAETEETTSEEETPAEVEETPVEEAEEAPKKLGWFARRKAAKAEKKVTKEQKKQAKKEAKEARKAEKAQKKQKNVSEEVIADEVIAEEPIVDEVVEEIVNDELVVEETASEETTAEETTEDSQPEEDLSETAQEQSEVEVDEDERNELTV